MSDYTINLNLLKKDPDNDGNDYFNIQTMLNDNWDKIDAGVAAKETPAGAQAKMDNLAGAGRTTQTVKGNADAITALNQTVTSHSVENATTAVKGHVQLATNAETTTGTNTTKAVTPAGVKAALEALIAAAPSALDTLNEIAVALGNDPNFATTMTNALAGKAALAHVHTAGDITSGILPIPRGGTGATSAAGILTAAGVTATAAELNILDGVTGVTAAELCYIGDVTGMIQAQLNAKSEKAPVPVYVSASRNIAATDAGTLLHCNSAGAIVLTIQTNATVAIPINTEIAIDRWGTGAVSIAPVAGVTLQSTGGKRSIKNQYESAALKKLGTDIWLLVGSLST